MDEPQRKGLIFLEEKNYMSKWELECIIFNSLIYKFFTGYTEAYCRYGGAAAWLTAIFSGTVFLIVLAVILKLYSPYSCDGLVYSLKKRDYNFLANYFYANKVKLVTTNKLNH